MFLRVFCARRLEINNFVTCQVRAQLSYESNIASLTGKLKNFSVLHTIQLHFHFSLSCIGAGNGNPLSYSCLETPSDRGAWWAAIYGVTKSRTRLKRLNSNSSIKDKIVLEKSISSYGESLNILLTLKCQLHSLVP